MSKKNTFISMCTYLAPGIVYLTNTDSGTTDSILCQPALVIHIAIIECDASRALIGCADAMVTEICEIKRPYQPQRIRAQKGSEL